jgi:hypothetical protein
MVLISSFVDCVALTNYSAHCFFFVGAALLSTCLFVIFVEI